MRLLCRRAVDFKIVELAALAGDAEFVAGLGRMSDAGGLEVTDGLAVEDNADPVSYTHLTLPTSP
jgi:hypothetical protein